MIVQAYQFNLKYNVIIATCGKLLNTNSLAAYTSIGSILIFCNNTTNFFNIKREIKCLEIIDQCLIMASENTLTVHDVENNFDQCFLELTDGINVMTIGQYNGQELIFIGGNCTIQGFNTKGEEICWNVASDEVLSLTIFGQENEYYIGVGTADNSIRLLKNDEIIYCFNVQSQPKTLQGYIYFDQWYLLTGLENGQIKLHRQNQELWTNNEEQEIITKIINCDDTQFIVGRQYKIELRQINNGQLIQKIQIEQQITQLLYTDLRGVGTNQIIIITNDGNVQGFSILEKEIEQQNLSKILNDLQLKKQELQQQLQLENLDKIPNDLQVGIGFQKNTEKQCINLIFYLKKQGYFIKQVIIYHDTYFKDGYIVNSEQPSDQLSVPLKLEENQKIQLNCKLFVAENPYGNFFLVLESQPTIPKFSNFFHTTQELKIESFIEAKIKERVPRYVKWIDQCFILNDQIKQSFEQTQEFTFNTINIINQQELSITFNSKEGKVIIKCDNISTCGDVIQDLCDFIQIQELMTIGQFPKEMQNFKKVLEQVQSHRQSKLQISGDVAEAMNLVKSYIVKAEDSRMIGDIQQMQKMYANTMVQNKLIQAELYKKRQNTETLTNNLKQINSMISKASKLRVGSSQTNITNMCRQAMKKKNLFSIIEIIQQGREI